MRVEQFSGDLPVVLSGSMIALDENDEMKLVVHLEEAGDNIEIH